MKKLIVNLVFSFSFVCFTILISMIFYDDFVQALSDDLFPKNKTLNIETCQQWTEEVRNFNMNEGEEANEVAVIMYHRIIDDKKIVTDHLVADKQLKKTIIPKSRFAEQMKLLKQEGYITLTAKEFELFMVGKLKVPKKSILLTFDDGYKDNFTEVYPILKEYNFKAVNFLITGAITTHKKSYNSMKHQYFSTDEVSKSCDVFEFQSHTYNFHKQTSAGDAYLTDKTIRQIKEDISTSLVNLNQRNRSFAYPFGMYNKKSIRALKVLGFKMAFTTDYKNAEPGMHMYEIPRKEVYPEDTLMDFKIKINLD